MFLTRQIIGSGLVMLQMIEDSVSVLKWRWGSSNSPPSLTTRLGTHVALVRHSKIFSILRQLRHLRNSMSPMSVGQTLRYLRLTDDLTTPPVRRYGSA